MGCHFLCQGIFSTQGWNLYHLLLRHGRQIPYYWAPGILCQSPSKSPPFGALPCAQEVKHCRQHGRFPCELTLAAPEIRAGKEEVRVFLSRSFPSSQEPGSRRACSCHPSDPGLPGTCMQPGSARSPLPWAQQQPRRPPAARPWMRSVLAWPVHPALPARSGHSHKISSSKPSKGKVGLCQDRN